MYGKYKVVCVTAAGRRRYLQYLIPLVLSNGLVDRYDLWVNTIDNCDIEFMRQMCDRYDKLNFVTQPEGESNGVYTLLSFWRYARERDTIYIRFDDDIVWLEPEFFEKLLKFRVGHREYLFVSPHIINNAKSTYLMQVRGALTLDRYTRSDVCGNLFWKDGCFATELHRWFIDNYLDKDLSPLYVGEQPVALCRFSINCMAWFGEDLQSMALQHKLQEEEYIAEILPVTLNRGNCFYGDVIAVHYAFWMQRDIVDASGLLDCYAASLQNRWRNDPAASEIFSAAKAVMEDVGVRERELKRRPALYSNNWHDAKGLVGAYHRLKYELWLKISPFRVRVKYNWCMRRCRKHIVR